MKKPRLTICCSGEGSLLESFVQQSREQKLHADIVGVIASRESIGAITKAKHFAIPSQVLARKSFSDTKSWDQAFLDQLKIWNTDYVILAGFLSLIGPKVLQAYQGRIINTHPALLPKFGGHGMYGMRVHEAVVANKEKVSGVSVHLVNELYDQGPLLAQKEIAVHPEDTPTTLAEKVKQTEFDFYPFVINEFICGRIKET